MVCICLWNKEVILCLKLFKFTQYSKRFFCLFNLGTKHFFLTESDFLLHGGTNTLLPWNCYTFEFPGGLHLDIWPAAMQKTWCLKIHVLKLVCCLFHKCLYWMGQSNSAVLESTGNSSEVRLRVHEFMTRNWK